MSKVWGFAHFALHLHRPGTRLQLRRVARRVVLVRAELVEVVVVGDLLERALLLVGGGLPGLQALELAAVRRLGRTGAAREQQRAGPGGSQGKNVSTAQEIGRASCRERV